MRITLSLDPHRAARCLRAGALGLALAMPVGAASAQYLDPPPPRFPRDRNIAVIDRKVPGYEPSGINIGAFTLHPSVKANAIYSDNIFAQESGRQDNMALRVAPAIRLSSNAPINRFALNLAGQFDRFASLTSENADRFDADATGVYELNHDTVVRARMRWQRLEEARSSQNAFVQTREPLRYDLTTAAIGISHDFNRVRLITEAAMIKTNYFNGSLADGTPVDTRSRDNDMISLRGRAEYAQSPGLSYFVQTVFNWRAFDAASTFQPERDSSGYEILAGVNFEPSALMRGEIGIGYLAQNFKSAFYGDTGNFGINAQLMLFPTQLTTISIEADRRVIDSGMPRSGAFLSTSAGLRIDHELLRTLILSATVDYKNDRFNDIDRRDNRYDLGLRGEYRLSPGLALNVNAARLHVSSDGLDRYRSYADDRLSVGVTLRR